MELVVLKQLPILEEQIKALSTEIQADIDSALSLECTTENKVAVKNVRSELSKKFKGFEQRRKEVKSAINKPYDDFNKLYDDYIGKKFKGADADLKAKIDDIENAEKAEKEKEVKAYFAEYLGSKNIDFITYENANINVTLSASPKSLKDQAKDFIDRVAGDLALIDTQENKAEILVEYKKHLNVSLAITTVSERHKAIEQEQAKVEPPRAEVKQSPKSGNVDDFLSSLINKPKKMCKVTVNVDISKLQTLEKLLIGYDYKVEV